MARTCVTGHAMYRITCYIVLSKRYTPILTMDFYVFTYLRYGHRRHLSVSSRMTINGVTSIHVKTFVMRLLTFILIVKDSQCDKIYSDWEVGSNGDIILLV